MHGVGTRMGITTNKDGMTAPQTPSIWTAYKLRWKRRRLLWRSFRSRWQLKTVADRTKTIDSDGILLFATMRNERERLDHFLRHYRKLGVSHFLIVDNASDDGTRETLVQQTDVSLWATNASYKTSRFGLDWVTWLQIKFGHRHWCVTVDADELLDYAGSDDVRLHELGQKLDAKGQTAMGALMLDLYPDGKLGGQEKTTNDDPLDKLTHFDNGPYRARRQEPLGNLWVQGGARERVFFADNPERSPTLNKLPFVKWNRRYCYVNSTHSMLPPILNYFYDGPGDTRPCGVLLHTKFLPSIVSKSETERARGQHFTDPKKFTEYYDQIASQPNMYDEASERYEGTEKLTKFELISSKNAIN